MSFNNLIKVRSFSGTVVNDFYNYLEPLMDKIPSKLSIHAGTNDAIINNAEEILIDLVQLKSYIQQRFSVTAILSCPTTRTDDIKAKHIVTKLCVDLNKLGIPVICNKNITDYCLGKGGKHPGLHLNAKVSCLNNVT